eukprot:SAG11_NODE_98_length_16927_cov_35.166211_20_plen_78_part_00
MVCDDAYTTMVIFRLTFAPSWLFVGKTTLTAAITRVLSDGDAARCEKKKPLPFHSQAQMRTHNAKVGDPMSNARFGV